MLRRFCSQVSTEIPPLTTTRALGTCAIGLVAGTLGSLVGLGGAFVTLPALSGPLGLSAHHSIGTSVAATLGTSIGASFSFARKEEKKNEECGEKERELEREKEREREKMNNLWGFLPIQKGDVNVIASLFIVASSSICAIFGARYSKTVRAVTIRKAQGVLMMVVAPLVLARDYLKPSTTDDIPLPNPENLNRPPTINDFLIPSFAGRLVGIGTLSGFLAGFFGVGGGAVVVPALIVLMNFDYKTALATSMAVMIPTTFSSAVIHIRQGTMLIPYSIPLAGGCFVGSIVGAKLVRMIDEKQLKQIFTGTMFLLGVRTFLKALR